MHRTPRVNAAPQKCVIAMRARALAAARGDLVSLAHLRERYIMKSNRVFVACIQLPPPGGGGRGAVVWLVAGRARHSLSMQVGMRMALIKAAR